MNPKDIENELSNASAFGNYNSISTSFAAGLEKSIMELAENNTNLTMSDVIERFGNYETVHKQIKRLVLENKLILYEMESSAIELSNFKSQQLKISNPDLSEWVDLTAQPCLTCPIFNECGLANPVSPATCQEFNTWLDEEIELEFGLEDENL